jgi:Tfp pilus assembly protein PilZ
VTWINICAEQGFHSVGLKLLDPECGIWEPGSIPDTAPIGAGPPTALLECQRCHQRLSTPVPEADTESLREGFMITRRCDSCKTSTAWGFRREEPAATEPPPQAATAPAPEATAATPAQKRGGVEKDQRRKGRAPIKMLVKIIRLKDGKSLFDVRETINISRTGVYFATNQGYEVGEKVEVILPYHPDSVAIPVQGRVVRQDERKETLQKGVAIHLISGTT